MLNMQCQKRNLKYWNKNIPSVKGSLNGPDFSIDCSLLGRLGPRICIGQQNYRDGGFEENCFIRDLKYTRNNNHINKGKLIKKGFVCMPFKPNL